MSLVRSRNNGNALDELLLLPCSLAFKQYATSWSHPKDYTNQADTAVLVALSDLSVPEPWTDWSISAWIFIDSGSETNILTTNPAHKVEVTGGNVVMSGDNINTQTRSVSLVSNKWYMLILGSNQQESYAIFTYREDPQTFLSTAGVIGIPAPLNPTATFEVMSGVTIFSVRVM